MNEFDVMKMMPFQHSIRSEINKRQKKPVWHKLKTLFTIIITNENCWCFRCRSLMFKPELVYVGSYNSILCWNFAAQLIVRDSEVAEKEWRLISNNTEQTEVDFGQSSVVTWHRLTQWNVWIFWIIHLLTWEQSSRPFKNQGRRSPTTWHWNRNRMSIYCVIYLSVAEFTINSFFYRLL